MEMETVSYITLAAARNADRERFDAILRKAFFDAVADVGKDVVIKAICGQHRQAEERKAA